MAAYNKAIVAFVGFLAATAPLFGVTILEDPNMQTALVTLITFFAVYLVPNQDKA